MTNVILFQSIYVDKDPVRNAELIACRAKNHALLAAGVITKIKYLNWIQDEMPLDVKSDLEKRMFVLVTENRPTYKDFMDLFEYDTVNIIANSDIYLDETIGYVQDLIFNHCWALCRWDVNADGSSTHYNHCDSQDTWIFYSQVPRELKARSNFNLGIPGCDNSIAHQIETCGYIVSSPSLTIRTHHLHLSGIRNYTREQTVPPPYKLFWPNEL